MADDFAQHHDEARTDAAMDVVALWQDPADRTAGPAPQDWLSDYSRTTGPTAPHIDDLMI